MSEICQPFQQMIRKSHLSLHQESGRRVVRDLLVQMRCACPIRYSPRCATHGRPTRQRLCHLLAPTGSDLSKYNEIGTVLAGFHYDLSFITIHGKSRFPGLYIWLKDGTKVQVKVPEGCLLLQAAKQLEH